MNNRLLNRARAELILQARAKDIEADRHFAAGRTADGLRATAEASAIRRRIFADTPEKKNA